MNYYTRRSHLFRRLQQQLAEPVANLLATVYEPRIDQEVSNETFNRLVAAKQRELRNAIKGLTNRDGGRVEIIAKGVAKELIDEAEAANLTMAATQLVSALKRCSQIRTPGQNRAQGHTTKLPDIERVIGQSGKPIGLWR